MPAVLSVLIRMRRAADMVTNALGAQIEACLEGESIDPEILKLVKASMLDITNIPPDPTMLVGINELPVCTRENFSVIIGRPGARKSFLSTGIGGAFLNENGCMGLENPTGTGKLLWIDTEQAGGHVGRIAKRLYRIAGFPLDRNRDNICIQLLREYKPEVRRKIFNACMIFHKPDFVVLDGIGDLITDTNNPEQSSEVITEVMSLTKKYNCHLLTVIHANIGSEKARGHLGSKALRKCETAIFAEADGEMTICRWAKTRDMRPDDFAFGVSEGLPVAVPYGGKSDKIDKLQQIISDAMPKLPNTISYTDLCNSIIKVTGVKIDAAKKRITKAADAGLIIKNSVGMYHLPTKDERDNDMPF